MNSSKLAQEIKRRLKALMVVMEKIVEGRHVPKIFEEAAFDELEKIHKIAKKLERKKE